MKKIVLFGLVFVVGLVLGFSINCSDSVEVLNDADLFPTLLKEINSADESMHLIVFEVDYDNNLSKDLIGALVGAQERGVDVKIVTDGVLFDHGKNYNYLTDLGLNVKSDTLDLVTHNKLIIIDSKKVVVGSSNWDYYSLSKNHESNVLVSSFNIANNFEEYFQEVWNDY